MCAEFPNSRVGWPGGARWDGPPLRLTSMSGRTSASGLLLLLAELLALPTQLPTPQRHLDSPVFAQLRKGLQGSTEKPSDFNASCRES